MTLAIESVETSMDTQSEKWRRETEARYWLRRGFTSRARIVELRELISSKRSQVATETLLADMREQWRRRAEWLEPAP